jgi:hypothetical protein
MIWGVYVERGVNIDTAAKSGLCCPSLTAVWKSIWDTARTSWCLFAGILRGELWRPIVEMVFVDWNLFGETAGFFTLR